jgi:hypothetical protein
LTALVSFEPERFQKAKVKRRKFPDLSFYFCLSNFKRGILPANKRETARKKKKFKNAFFIFSCFFAPFRGQIFLKTRFVALFQHSAPKLAVGRKARDDRVEMKALRVSQVAVVGDALDGGFDATPRFVRSAFRAAVEKDVEIYFQLSHVFFEPDDLLFERGGFAAFSLSLP